MPEISDYFKEYKKQIKYSGSSWVKRGIKLIGLCFSLIYLSSCSITIDSENIKEYAPEIVQPVVKEMQNSLGKQVEKEYSKVKKDMGESIDKKLEKVEGNIDKKIQKFNEDLDKKMKDLKNEFDYKVEQFERRMTDKFEHMYLPSLRETIYSYKPSLPKSEVDQIVRYIRQCFEEYTTKEEFKENVKNILMDVIDDEEIIDKTIKEIQERAVFKEKK